jgi:8-oxo-dGTP diphosphatase
VGPKVVADGVVRAAGGVLTRVADDVVEVVVVHRPKHADWSFPKGHLHPGETDVDAALREVEEETGVAAEALDVIGEVRYTVDGRPKAVRYWHMRPVDDASPFDPDDEVDEVRWVSVEVAGALLTHQSDIGLLPRISGLLG